MITTALSYIASMTPPDHNLPASGRQLALVGASSADQLPAIFLRSESAGERFWEFFTANIRNRNTRRAYFVAVTQFSKWCDQKKLRLEDNQPIHVAAYIEQLGAVLAKPTVKQHLAAIRSKMFLSVPQSRCARVHVLLLLASSLGCASEPIRITVTDSFGSSQRHFQAVAQEIATIVADKFAASPPIHFPITCVW